MKKSYLSNKWELSIKTCSVNVGVAYFSYGISLVQLYVSTYCHKNYRSSEKRIIRLQTY